MTYYRNEDDGSAFVGVYWHAQQSRWHSVGYVVTALGWWLSRR